MDNIFKTKGILISFVIALVGAILLVSTLFMPYASAKQELANDIDEYPNEIVDEELGMTAKEIKHLPMIEYSKMYVEYSETDSDLMINVIIFAVIGGLSLLTLLFVTLRLPIPAIILNLLSLGALCLQNADFKSRGVVPSEMYDWGIGYYVFFISTAVILVGAVWMMVCKILARKGTKAE